MLSSDTCENKEPNAANLAQRGFVCAIPDLTSFSLYDGRNFGILKTLDLNFRKKKLRYSIVKHFYEKLKATSHPYILSLAYASSSCFLGDRRRAKNYVTKTYLFITKSFRDNNFISRFVNLSPVVKKMILFSYNFFFHH